MVPNCFQRAGDCNKAYDAYKKERPQASQDGFAKIEDAAQREQIPRSSFESMISKCKDK